MDLARRIGQSPDDVKLGVATLARLGVLEFTKNGDVRCPFDRIEWPATG
jgi:predicted transcriptional regulator